MKKGIRRVIVLLLALSMVFTTMGLPAYADEAGLADGTYNANGLSTAVLNMYNFHDAQVVVKGDNAWLITTEDTDKTVERFDGMAYGPQSQILDPDDETNHTLVEGTATATVVPVYKEDGTLETRTFVLPVPKSVIESGSDIYYMIKYTAGYSNTHDGDWYKASGGDYYFSGYTLEKVSDSTALPGEETPDDPQPSDDQKIVDAFVEQMNAADYYSWIVAGEMKVEDIGEGDIADVKAAVLNPYDALTDAQKELVPADMKTLIESIREHVAALEEPVVETETIELVPTNEELMFKVVNAYIEKKGDKAELVFALSGGGYEDVIPGTYDDAMDVQVGASHDTWIHGEKADVNCDYWTDRATDTPPLNHYEEGVLNKWQFRIPVELPASGTVKVPVVAVSKSRYQKAEKADAENPDYSAAFTSRQFVINLDEKTVRTGNLRDTFDVTVTSNIESFAVAETGSLYTVGTPKANEYTCQPTVTMADLTYDKAFLGTKEEAAAEGAETIAIGEDKSFTLGFFNTLDGKQHIVDGKATAAFHVAANAPYAEKDTWVERTFTFDIENKTITVTGDELTAEEVTYDAGEYIVGVESIKTADGTSYGMFIPNYNGVPGKALVTVAADGSATINYYNTRNTYPKIFLAELDADSLNKVATAEQLADPRCITAEVYAGNSSYREFTYPFDISDLGKTVPYVTLNKKDTFNKTQTAFVFDQTMMSKAAFEVVGLIDTLPAAEDVTVRDKDAIEAARAAYNDLTAAQKADVSNLNKLVAAEEAFAALAGKDEATEAVEAAISTLIQQYTDVNETTAAAVADTRAAYDALTKQQKAYIDDATLFKLHRAEACVAFVNDGIAEGAVYDMAIDTSDNSPFIAATISPRPNAAYVYLYSVAGEYNNANLVAGTVSKSSHSVVGNGSVLKGLWQVKTTEGQGRTFTVQLTGANGNSDNYTVKVPSVYGVMAEGTYQVAAIQTPSSSMRKFERSTITSDGAAMNVEFVMPNTTYVKLFLGTKEEAETATEGFIEPTGTEPTSGTTGVGNVYSIPLESMYMPITISYCTSKGKWTQETVEFVVDEQSQAVIDATAALNLDTYFYVTADQREQVTLADGLYQALNDNQKAVVENSNYSTLKKTVAMFVTADKVAAQIEALPAADAIGEDDVAKIREAKDAFDNMGNDPELMEALNGNSLQNSQIEKLISQELRDKLNACAAAIPADYTAVEAAIETVPADFSIYTEETAKAVTDAVAKVDRTKHYSEQSVVDAMAKAIDDAVEALIMRPADYSAVDAAIAKVPKDMSKYTDASVKAVNDAVNAVVRGKMANEQTAVDNMAKAINNAVAGLKLKEVKQGWKKENGSWYYYTNGTAAKNTWKKDSKGWCYLGSDGKMVTNGWAKDSHGWCWIGANGYMVEQTKWIKSGGSWYHITKGYRDQSKWMKDSKGWCYLGSDGKMVTNGWAKDSHGWCWMGSNGYWVSNKWVKDKGEWYYIKSNHYMAANEWAKDSGGWMYMAANGKITKSKWVKSGGYWYYMKDNGYMATGTLKIGGKTYKFDGSGKWVK